MGTPSERKLHRDDYQLILRMLTDMVKRLQATERKAMYRYMDPVAATAALYDMDNVYIVGEAYLVAYSLGTPWYCPDNVVMLTERLVLRLAAGGGFEIIPEFLSRKAAEAGAVLAIAGTALAKSDEALASLYHRAGFSTQALTLVKET
jgi:hypothetical protein